MITFPLKIGTTKMTDRVSHQSQHPSSLLEPEAPRVWNPTNASMFARYDRKPYDLTSLKSLVKQKRRQNGSGPGLAWPVDKFDWIKLTLGSPRRVFTNESDKSDISWPILQLGVFPKVL